MFNRNDFSYFRSSSHLPIKFGVNWPSSSGEAVKYRFSGCGHGGLLEFHIVTILVILDLQVIK